MAVADRYDLLARLGAGSFGEVFRAVERVTGLTVALKVLHRQDCDSLLRFYREAVALHAQLGNEHVVALLDSEGLDDEEPHLALEFCELGSLRSWVGEGSDVEIATALLHAARGLAGVHAANGLHRDVKPENLLAAKASEPPGWCVKVADFGLAAFPDPVSGTMTFNAGGTKGYIAPEVLAGALFHERADVYSLGVVGIELLVGAIDVSALLASPAPEVLQTLLQSMVSGVPEKRPAAAQVVEELENLLATASGLGQRGLHGEAGAAGEAHEHSSRLRHFSRRSLLG
jgi:serine/threonine protein kinase